MGPPLDNVFQPPHRKWVVTSIFAVAFVSVTQYHRIYRVRTKWIRQAGRIRALEANFNSSQQENKVLRQEKIALSETNIALQEQNIRLETDVRQVECRLEKLEASLSNLQRNQVELLQQRQSPPEDRGRESDETESSQGQTITTVESLISIECG